MAVTEPVPTIESLQADLAAKVNENATLVEKAKKGDDLNVKLQADLDAKVKENATLTSQVNDAIKIIEDQHLQLSKEDTFTESTVFTHDKKKYRVVVPKFSVGGKEVTAAQLKEDKALQKVLVDNESSILQLLTEVK